MRLAAPGLLLLLCAAPLTAQTATLSGSVFCGDNGTPARFARVELKRITPASSGNDQGPRATPQVSSPGAGPGTVSLDGHYTIAGIAPGSYYVHVTMPGYTDPLTIFTNEELSSPDPNIKALIAQAVPVLTVVGSESSHIDLRLERSAAISGRILYDDGSPAQGWNVTVQRAADTTRPPAQMEMMVGGAILVSSVGVGSFANITDDRGIFRVTSLAPGNYLVRASYNGALFHGNIIGARPETISITVFNGSVFRSTQAKPISITAGEEHVGVDLTVPLNGLRNISGFVVAKSDSHPINSGTLTLTTTDDPSFRVSTAINSDGSYLFHSIPGKTTYTLSATGFDAPPPQVRTGNQSLNVTTATGGPIGMSFTPAPPPRRPYGTAKTEIHLEDMDITGLTIALPPADSESSTNGR